MTADQYLTILDFENVPTGGTTKAAVVNDALALAFRVMDEPNYSGCHRLIKAKMADSPAVFPLTASFSLAILGHHVVGSLVEQLEELGVPKADAITRVVERLNRSVGGDR